MHSFIHKCQHGFTTGRSCVTLLAEVLDIIGSLLDTGGQIDTMYLDMSKAFDRVSHQPLILAQFGFGENLLQWFESYLNNRSQRVTIPWGTSESRPVTSGVAQGSILGPMLFLLFANDLPNTVVSSNVATYADDTKLHDNVSQLQTDLNNISAWATTAGMTFNSSKGKDMRVIRKHNQIENAYVLDGQTLHCTKAERGLGVWITNDLMWSRAVFQGFVRRSSRSIRNISVLCTSLWYGPI